MALTPIGKLRLQRARIAAETTVSRRNVLRAPRSGKQTLARPTAPVRRHARPLPVNDSEHILAPDEAANAALCIEGLMFATTRHEYGWTPTPFHQLLCKIAENIANGVPGWERVILNTPPQHGKSETMSSGLPSYFLGTHPHLNVILASYGADFAEEWGGKVRDRLADFGEQIFGVQLNTTSRSRKHFKTTRGGQMFTAGARGPLTGRGAALILIDDPIKNDEQASSPTYQDKTWHWYCATVRSRIRRGTRILLTMTRWHENDLAGRLIAESEAGTGEKFRVINLPAIAEEIEDWRQWGVDYVRRPGEALCPELHNEQELAQTRLAVGSYWWSALYQGRPTPDSGDIFHREWFRWWGWAPSGFDPFDNTWAVYPLPARFDLIVVSWDMAFKDKKSSSFVVGQVWGLHGCDHYLLDQVKGQWSFPKTLKWVRTVHEAWPQADKTLIEDKANGPAVEATLKDEIAGIEMIEPERSKLARARGTSAISESRHTYIPGHLVPTHLGGDQWVHGDFPHATDGSMTPGAKGWVGEHVSFPNGMFDDQVDCSSQAQGYLRIKQMAGAVGMLSGRGNQRMQTAAMQPNKALQLQAANNRVNRIKEY